MGTGRHSTLAPTDRDRATRNVAGPSHRHAFTLIELLVAVATLTLLLSILLPSLSGARGQARAVMCASNIRQLAVANAQYADENDGQYCPGAIDMMTNLHRWHGTRDDTNEPFDPARGPLVPFLGPTGRIRDCPSFGDFAVDAFAFERGGGGYGYNNAFVGSVVTHVGDGIYRLIDDRSGIRGARIRRPGQTVMFTDSAFARDELIEYSFAEPRFHPAGGFRADPSIHFRHAGLTSVAWCDTHVDRQRRTFTWSSGMYPGDPDHLGLGWFGSADDNALFDPQ